MAYDPTLADRIGNLLMAKGVAFTEKQATDLGARP